MLVDRHQEAIYGFVLQQLGDRHAAAELTQVVFVRAYTGLRGYRGDVSLPTWLQQIAGSECRSRQLIDRRRHTMPLDDVAEAAEAGEGPESAGAVDSTGLRQVQSILTCGEALVPPAWSDQLSRIMALVDEVAVAEKARTAGFDARIFLPLVAAAVISVAGIVSLQSGNESSSHTRPALAALRITMQDPRAIAQLSDVLGEPVLFSEPLWAASEMDVVELGPWSEPDMEEMAMPHRELDEGEAVAVE